MKLAFYGIFGEKFITFLIVALALEAVILAGFAIFLIIREVLQTTKPHPKK